jgi:riboflavin kinase/FMN adenylyltransferase
MRILNGLEGLRQVPAGSVVSIGNFDGVHRGHQRLLSVCRERANLAGGQVVVVTFEPHPLTVLRPSAVPPRLTTAEMKQELLESQGVEAYVVLAPEPAVLNLSAEEFWAILRDETRPSHLIEGPEFTFGKGRRGTAEKLLEWSAGTGVRFEAVEPESCALLDLSLVRISSTIIRWLLKNGRVRDAAICLGRPYALRGAVIKGFGRGRTIGVPTANLDCAGQFVPADGVYAGRCRVGDRAYAAAVSIGDMPTYTEGKRQIEAHLLDFDSDLYGKTLDLELTDWLRDQRKFSGTPALMKAIEEDIVQTRRRTALDPSMPIVQAVVSNLMLTS